MYSTHNEGKYVAAERLIRRLKTKMCKYMTSVSKNVYLEKLDVIANKDNNTYLSTIKTKPSNAKSTARIDFNKENNKENPNFKVGDHVRVSKNKNNFAEGYVPNCSNSKRPLKYLSLNSHPC